MESDDEILPEARVFEFRAQNLLQSKYEALQELLNKAPEEVEDINEDIELFGKPKKARGRKPRKGTVIDEITDAIPKKTKKRATAVEKKKDSSLPRRNQRGATPIDEDDSMSPPRRNWRGSSPDENEIDSPPKKTRKPRAKMSDLDGGGKSVKLPAVSIKRIQELQLNSSRHKRRVDMENERILSAFDSISAEVEPQSPEDIEYEQSIILKCQFMLNVSNIRVKLKETFATVFDKVAAMHNLQASEILLCVGDQTIKPTDTPYSLNLKYFDVIDCLPYKPSYKEEVNSAKFRLKMQSNDTRKKLDVYGSRVEKFQNFMDRYSKLRGIPLKKLSFEFDGEKINGFETPEELEVESGSCIDVKVRTEEPVQSIDSESDIEITTEVRLQPDNKLILC